ncbi:MAG: DNA methyltransferase [Sulfolobales archaeon]|nr:DNA methyltransferase [Sulfolobales archaeon]MCX8198730.1 DNA methyltransferase [Sulfolobales archaeon]MDW8169803.1 DNA methyltransferase [Desulfurococcaceae archaeon]
MREITLEEYLNYVSKNNKVVIEDQEISLEPIDVTRFTPTASELTDASTTVWSFPERGSWGTHRGDYRGNWAPQIPRALIEMYTEPGETVLDSMAGSGTTCIEARLLGRNCIAIDINYNAAILTYHRLYWLEESAKTHKDQVKQREVDNVLRTWSRVYCGDARKPSLIDDNSIDLIAIHPPYWNIIEYSSKCIEGDLSCTRTLEEYLNLIREAAQELYRVLKPGRHLGILIGDTRVRKHYIPVSHYVMRVFLQAGFILKEEVIKIQHKMKTTRKVWSKLKDRGFLLIYHEKLYVFRKPASRKELEKYKYSLLIY